MNKYTLFSFALGALVLVGAGCAISDSTPDGVNEGLEDTLGITQDADSDHEDNENEDNDNMDTDTDSQGEVSLSDFTAPPTSHPGVLKDADRLDRTVTIKTSKGDVTVELFGEESPMAVSNFLVLANTGYYDGIIFHRVIKGFMIQGGDPTGTGTSGPGYQFADELGGAHTTYPIGTLAMANSGPNTNGSQFFVMHGDVPLPNAYTIFGQVTAGQDVIDAIAESETSGPPRDKPVTDITIDSIELN
jgi:cyclophilin family peptidyl-prolyl cis-trans isomerase